jgi:Fic family protein
MLIDSNLLHLPIVYPSYYFKKHSLEYYQRLDAVRTHGDFEGWITYYLQAIKHSAVDAYKRAQDIEALEIDIKNTIDTHRNFTKIKDSAYLILNTLFKQPITTITQISKQTGKAYNTVKNTMKIFMNLKLITKNDTQTKSKIYKFDHYLQLLEKEYE